MKSLILTLALTVAACGGNKTPTAPTPTPTPAPIPVARITLFGNGQFSFCNSFGCIFQLPIQNEGPGCASAVRGTVTFFTASNVALGTYQWSLNAATVLRVGESAVTPIVNLPGGFNAQTSSYRIDPAWTDVRCS